eukprot:Gregarina_sp_Poly_1__5496@NODE_28_length_19636_cov_263_287087_g25_i0_p7_GENE_NODE_28_length_19636_cov_263_287087_g25_i0NODE_28_length_19636_cov_263_287087_g25_i0_p7_ORF_typecomplete_len443_score50_34PP2C/PF00481_21/2_4e09_NODE_28_length_19636_cov_263_287087_g25_i01608517413
MLWKGWVLLWTGTGIRVSPGQDTNLAPVSSSQASEADLPDFESPDLQESVESADSSIEEQYSEISGVDSATEIEKTQYCQKAFDIKNLSDLTNSRIPAMTLSQVDRLENVATQCDISGVEKMELIRSSLKGSRHGPFNQDSVVTHCARILGADTLVMGIFDGHGVEGHNISNFAASRLSNILAERSQELRGDFLAHTLEKIQLDVLEHFGESSNSGSTGILVSLSQSRDGLLINMASLGDSMAEVYSTYAATALLDDTQSRSRWIYKTQRAFGPDQNCKQPIPRRKIHSRFQSHGYTAFSSGAAHLNNGCRVGLRPLEPPSRTIFVPNAFLEGRPHVDGCAFFTDCGPYSFCLPGNESLDAFAAAKSQFSKLGFMDEHYWGFANTSRVEAIPLNDLSSKFKWYSTPKKSIVVFDQLVGLQVRIIRDILHLLFSAANFWTGIQ